MWKVPESACLVVRRSTSLRWVYFCPWFFPLCACVLWMFMHLCKQSPEKTYFKYSFEIEWLWCLLHYLKRNFTALTKKTSFFQFIFRDFGAIFFFSSLFCGEEDELDLAKGMEQSTAFRVSFACFCLALVFIKLNKLPRGCEGGLCKTTYFGLWCCLSLGTFNSQDYRQSWGN